MEKIEKHYPGKFVFSCGVERLGNEIVTINDISVCRIYETSKHSQGKRLAKILKKQFLKYKFPGINLIVGQNVLEYSGWDKGESWDININ